MNTYGRSRADSLTNAVEAIGRAALPTENSIAILRNGTDNAKICAPSVHGKNSATLENLVLHCGDKVLQDSEGGTGRGFKPHHLHH
jgi:hypothetical protein